MILITTYTFDLRELLDRLRKIKIHAKHWENTYGFFIKVSKKDYKKSKHILKQYGFELNLMKLKLKSIETELCKFEKNTVCFDMIFIKGTSVMKRVDDGKTTYFFALNQESGETWGWDIPVDTYYDTNIKSDSPISIEDILAKIKRVNEGLPTFGYIREAKKLSKSESAYSSWG